MGDCARLEFNLQILEGHEEKLTKALKGCLGEFSINKGTLKITEPIKIYPFGISIEEILWAMADILNGHVIGTFICSSPSWPECQGVVLFDEKEHYIFNIEVDHKKIDYNKGVYEDFKVIKKQEFETIEGIEKAFYYAVYADNRGSLGEFVSFYSSPDFYQNKIKVALKTQVVENKFYKYYKVWSKPISYYKQKFIITELLYYPKKKSTIVRLKNKIVQYMDKKSKVNA